MPVHYQVFTAAYNPTLLYRYSFTSISVPTTVRAAYSTALTPIDCCSIDPSISKHNISDHYSTIIALFYTTHNTALMWAVHETFATAINDTFCTAFY